MKVLTHQSVELSRTGSLHQWIERACEQVSEGVSETAIHSDNPFIMLHKNKMATSQESCTKTHKKVLTGIDQRKFKKNRYKSSSALRGRIII